MKNPKIDPFEREEFLRKREQFLRIKGQLVEQILVRREEIDVINKKILRAMPRTSHGVEICTYCEVKSLRYIGRETRPDDSYKVYICELCNRELKFPSDAGSR
jgi:hypothetical protein